MSSVHLANTSRTSVFAPLAHGGRAEAIERRLSDAIALGHISDGEQLPSEADLARQFGVATVTLREALAELRRQGLIETRRGRGGGTFVRAPAGGIATGLQRRIRALPFDRLRDLTDHHAALATAAAELAATRAGERDLERLRAHAASLLAAKTPAARQRADSRLHVEIAAAARSPRLTAAEAELQAELAPLLWMAIEAAAGMQRVADEHTALVTAIADGDPARARAAAAAHVAADGELLAGLHLRASEGDRTDGPHGAPEAVLGVVEALVDTVLASLDQTRGLLLDRLGTATDEGRGLRRSDLAGLADHLHGELRRHRGVITGTGIVCADGVVEDADRWLEWWCASADGTPRFLDVVLDPEDSSAYEYDDAEWFARARDTRTAAVVGPYVDFSGTDLHILTVSVPAHDGERFLGVVGADLAVGELEHHVLPALQALPTPAALVNRVGRIVVSSDARHGPGTRLDAAAGARELASSGVLGWSVVAT